MLIVTMKKKKPWEEQIIMGEQSPDERTIIKV